MVKKKLSAYNKGKLLTVLKHDAIYIKMVGDSFWVLKKDSGDIIFKCSNYKNNGFYIELGGVANAQKIAEIEPSDKQDASSKEYMDIVDVYNAVRDTFNKQSKLDYSRAGQSSKYRS